MNVMMDRLFMSRDDAFLNHEGKQTKLAQLTHGLQGHYITLNFVFNNLL